MLRLIVRGLLDLFWPPRTRCLVCDGTLADEPVAVCSACWDSIGFRPGVRQCSNCARPMAGEGLLCEDCAAGVPFGHVFALGMHEGALRKMIHLLKFQGRSELGEPLGRMLGALVTEPPDLIVPVPLHRSRLRERGYNQAALIAQGIGLVLAAPLADRGLLRLRSTGHQAKLDRSGRLHNLDGAFGTGKGPPWVGKSVLLVDDVLTTGATAAAVAQTLCRAGARSVNLAVVAVSTTPVRSVAG